MDCSIFFIQSDIKKDIQKLYEVSKYKEKIQLKISRIFEGDWILLSI